MGPMPYFKGEIISGGGVSKDFYGKHCFENKISLREKFDPENPLCQAKEARLKQINTYCAEVLSMKSNYKDVVNQFLSKPCNLYSVQLRPRVQDTHSIVINPVFTINRNNDQGNPLSPLYNEMQNVFSLLNLSSTDLTSKVLSALPKNADFDQIK